MRATHKKLFAAGCSVANRQSLTASLALLVLAVPACWAAENKTLNASAIKPTAVPPSAQTSPTGAQQTAAPSAQSSQPGQPTAARAATPSSTPPSTPASALTTTADPPVERMILKPGKSLSIGMATEDIICTNDVDLARKQRESYSDSPEASFIYAVALSRTSHVEDALKEVRRARRLAEKQGGPSYFDKMIDTYEKMLTYYPDDNQVRYHLAWAYYMKAYVLAKYSHLANTPQAKYKEWVAQVHCKSWRADQSR